MVGTNPITTIRERTKEIRAGADGIPGAVSVIFQYGLLVHEPELTYWNRSHGGRFGRVCLDEAPLSRFLSEDEVREITEACADVAQVFRELQVAGCSDEMDGAYMDADRRLEVFRVA